MCLSVCKSLLYALCIECTRMNWLLLQVMIALHIHTCLMQVFLDEINTSSCIGLLKEVLVDRTFFGQVGVLHTGAFLRGSNSAYAHK